MDVAASFAPHYILIAYLSVVFLVIAAGLQTLLVAGSYAFLPHFEGTSDWTGDESNDRAVGRGHLELRSCRRRGRSRALPADGQLVCAVKHRAGWPMNLSRRQPSWACLQIADRHARSADHVDYCILGR
jgi:hypothetical protein